MKIEDCKRIRFENGKTQCFKDCIQISSNILFVQKEKLWAIVDGEGNKVSAFKYLKPYCNGSEENCHGLMLSVQNSKGRYGAIDCYGNEAITCQYDNCQIVHCHYAIVSERNGEKVRKGVVDYKGRLIVPIKFNEIIFTGCGFLAKDNLWGMFNSRGKLVIPFAYIKLSIANESLSYFGIHARSGEYHFLDNSGKIFKRGKLK